MWFIINDNRIRNILTKTMGLILVDARIQLLLDDCDDKQSVK